MHVIPKDEIPLEFIKSSKLFPKVYRNVLMLANTNSGKTNTLFNIIKRSVNTNTTIFIFAGQLYQDASWKHIVKWLEDHNIPYVLNTSIFYEEGENQLKELLDHFKKVYEDEFNQFISKNGQEQQEEEDNNNISLFPDSDDESDKEDEDIPNHKIKPSKRRKLAPDNVFIFDDLSAEINNSSLIASLLKENRHYKSQTYILTQYFKDIKPGARTNLDYMLLYPNLPANVLKDIHHDTALAVQEKVFNEMYHEATAKKYHFLYVDIKNNKYRSDFNEEFELPQ